MGQLEQRSFEKGQIIFREGVLEKEMCMYEIVQGEVSIWADYGEASQKQLAVLKDGQYFGEMGLVEYMQRSATSVAETDVLVNVITGKAMAEWFKTSPDKVMAVMNQLGQRTRELTEDYLDACRTADSLLRSRISNEELDESFWSKVKKFAQVWKRGSRSS